ncbi:COG2256: ATPase related to the helicase subunit of the Holliday junction resolvase [[Actinomadura] parvosata subsp. kistnae]|nr:COG2256: ATPase related to the helicase subunit of the Holliday junction resolvase [Actinomadura parvosata subsp. kistnae]
MHGPGGVGKSALLRRFAQEAALAGRSVARLDGRTLEPSPAAFEREAEPVLRDERAVLLVDTFERIQGLEGWLRERFLPRLPLGALVVIAGRFPPDMRWQADPGWADALEVLSLRDLPPRDAAALMDCCGVAAELREPLLAFAGGHPLALLLGAAVAMKDGGASKRWTPRHDVVSTLLDQLVGEVPSPAHRHALEVCAHAYMTTEDLLRAALPDDAAALFRWLRRLPFVESSSLGLYPHDVVREVLEADLRWRDPQGYADMHDRIHAHLAEKVRTAADSEVVTAVTALFYLHRNNNAMVEPHSWYEEGEVQEGPLRPGDAERLVSLAHAAEGEESAACAAFWLARRPSEFRVYTRAETGEPIACYAWLRLEEPDAEECAADPVVAAAWEHARATAPLRAGEHLAVGRSWVLPAYRGKSPVMDLLQWRVIGNCLRAERMAWSYVAVRRPSMDRVECFRRHDMRDIPDAARVGDGSYTLFAHDWRAVPAHTWLERLNRALMPEPYETVSGLVVMSREEFAEEIRKALRLLGRPDALARSPLTRSRLVAEHGGGDPGAVLRELLEREIEALGEDPRSVKFHRAVAATYVKGAPTQELAAERLGLPFTTYRRHLVSGIERICESLWQRELYGPQPLEPAARPPAGGPPGK